MTTIKPNWLTIAVVNNNQLVTFGRFYDRKLLLQEISDRYNESYGSQWSVVLTGELPDDFSVETYTIEKGHLVKASAEIIAERKAVATATYNEQQRKLRESEYRAVTDLKALEVIADSTTTILAIKEEIRAKYPYKE